MDYIHNISIIFLSIFFESLPFLLLGSLISASIERFVSHDTLAKLIPKNVFLGTIVGVFLGFFLPACDCAVIPVSKRLVKKGVPLNVCVSFMLASPIINPVVLLSTYSAFYKTNRDIFWNRFIFGIIIAFVIGIIIGLLFKNKDVLKDEHSCGCSHTDGCLCHGHNHEHEDDDFSELERYSISKKKRLFNNLGFIFKHTAIDLFDVVKYLMFGALIASLIQVFMPRSVITIFSTHSILSIFVLMLFAYLISLCSTSDSFVGKSLVAMFGEYSILAYLLLGPMIDIKNTIVLLGNYKSKFVFTLISLIFVVIFITCLLLGVLL